MLLLKPHTLLVLDRIRAEQLCEATLVWQGSVGVDVRSAPRAEALHSNGTYSPRYTHIEEAPRSTWAAAGEEIVFASAIGLERKAQFSSFAHDGSTTRVVVDGWAVDEDWTSPQPRVERCAD